MNHKFSKIKKAFACIQAFAMLTAFSPMPIVSAAAEPHWHIAQTTYNTNDYIVAGYEAKDFGIIANGKTDVTAKIQKALDALYNIGGGTLFLPSGKYVIKGTLKIPQGVTLAGDWQSPDKSDGRALGTVLMAYSGKGYTDINNNYDNSPDNIPFITLEPNAHITNLNIWYPEQSAENPVPYPTTIRMYDPKTWGAENARISNITFVNSYNAIRQGPYSSGCPNIDNVYITPIGTAVDMDGLTDVGRFTNIHISPNYWINAELDNIKEYESSLREYIKENAVGIKLGRIDWSYLSFADVEGCNHGIEFVLSHSVLSYENNNLDGNITSWSYPNGQAYKLNISDCNVGLFSEGCSGAGMLVAEANITDCSTAIETVNGVESNGNLEISNSVISGSEYSIKHNGLTRMCIGNSKLNGNIDVQNSQISIAGAEYENSTVTLRDNSDTIYNKNGNVITKSGQVILSGNNLPTVYNQNNTAITYNNDTYIPPNVSSITEPPVLETKPYKSDIFVVTDSKYNAPHNDVAFQSYNEPCEQDASEAIQKALDDAEKNGGGIVFCPPGRYTLKSQLKVADGVELRGAVDHSRLPLKNGTIFDTPVSENEFLNTSFTDLNTKTINGVENCLSGNTIFSEVPNPTTDENGEIGRSITVTPYGLRLFSAANAEQAHAFDHSTQFKCGESDSKYVIEAIVSPKSIKSSGEFFITLSRNQQSTTANGTVKNTAKDGFRIANFKAENNILELPNGVTLPFSNSEMYLFRWELDLTDINNKTIKTTVIGTKNEQNGKIYTSEAQFPNAYQGNTDNVGHILLQASKVSEDKNPTGDSEILIHGISVRQNKETDEPAWVLLESGSGINGITFNCINQQFLPSPNPSPYMIQGQGDNIYVKNIALRNVYNGIDFKSYKCDNYYIDGIAGIAWNKEIEIANSDNGVLQNTQFNWSTLLYGAQTKLGCWENSPPNSYTDSSGNTIDTRGEICEPFIRKSLAANLDCITVDNCKNTLLFNNFSIFGSNSLTLKGNTQGLCIGQGADGSRYGIRLGGNADVDFINTQIVSFYYTDSSHITTDEDYISRCDFLNLSAWSTPSANIRSYGGKIHVYNATFNGVSKDSFADLNNNAYAYIQSGWINNANNSLPLLNGDGNISFDDVFWNRAYTFLPTADKPDVLPTPAPRAPLSPRPGTFEPLKPAAVYSINFGKEVEFNRVQLIWDNDQYDDITINAGETVLQGTVNGKVLNILNGAVSTSADNTQEEYDLHTIKTDNIQIKATKKPAIKLYKDENLQKYITSSESTLPDGERLFDGITHNPNDSGLSNNYYVSHLYPFTPDTTVFESQTADITLDDSYNLSKIILYTWGSNGWYPKSYTISSDTDSYSYDSPSPQGTNYPNFSPYVLDTSLNLLGDQFTIAFSEGGYSDINNPDTKTDGTPQYKFGFRIYEIELYGSKDAVWSSDTDSVYYKVNVNKTNIPDGTNVSVTYDGNEISQSALVAENTAITISAPNTDGYTLSVTVNNETLPQNDNGVYTYTVKDDTTVSIEYTEIIDDSEKLIISESSDNDCITVSAENLKETDSTYNGILAIYDKSKLLVYTAIQKDCSPSTDKITFDNINIPDGEYTVILYRWKCNDIFNMTPLQVPLLYTDYSK